MSIGFHLPDSTSTISLSVVFADYLKNNPEMFRENVKIASYFGSFPLLWNGGRMMMGRFFPDRAKAVVDAYNSRGIPYRLTFTNPLVTEEHLDNPGCNLMLNIADNGMNEVIVYSEVLENYIRQTHPKMKITSSTCKCIRDIDGVKAELAKDYSLVVLDYNFNNRMDELEKLTPDERKRCEILSNPVCVPNCPRRAAHYEYIGKMQLEKLGITRQYPHMDAQTRTRLGITEWECEHRKLDLFDGKEHPLRLSADDIYGRFVPMGFENFKIEGRAANIMLLCEQFVRYMVKPEFIEKARVEIMTATLEYSHLNF